jgi:hypothetical protein
MEQYQIQKTCKCGHVIRVEFETNDNLMNVSISVQDDSTSLRYRRGQFPQSVRCMDCSRTHSFNNFKKV